MSTWAVMLPSDRWESKKNRKEASMEAVTGNQMMVCRDWTCSPLLMMAAHGFISNHGVFSCKRQRCDGGVACGLGPPSQRHSLGVALLSGVSQRSWMCHVSFKPLIGCFYTRALRSLAPSCLSSGSSRASCATTVFFGSSDEDEAGRPSKPTGSGASAQDQTADRDVSTGPEVSSQHYLLFSGGSLNHPHVVPKM